MRCTELELEVIRHVWKVTAFLLTSALVTLSSKLKLKDKTQMHSLAVSRTSYLLEKPPPSPNKSHYFWVFFKAPYKYHLEILLTLTLFLCYRWRILGILWKQHSCDLPSVQPAVKQERSSVVQSLSSNVSARFLYL